jgi:serine/threonine protein kinase
MPRSELPTNDLRTETGPPRSAGTVPPSEEATTLPVAPARPDARPMPAIPGYRVLGRLGEGGMGEVYDVVDEKVGVRLALKMIRPDRVGADFLARFRQEIRAMMLLDHPNIARIYGHGEVGGCPFFTMKFFAGGALVARQDEFRADARKAVELTVKVADAVAYLHEQGKIHRDLKLSNVLLDDAGEPHLSDFGLVKEYGELPHLGGPPERPGAAPEVPDAETSPGGTSPDGGALTRTGSVMGTFAYMAPEQTRGAGGAGLHSDVWALGVILYELLAGRKPFAAADTDELFRQINEASPPPPSTFRDRPEPELDAIVLKCLAKDAAARYESVGAFAGALRGWLAGKAPPKKRRWVEWVLAGAAVVCLALLAAALVPRPRPQPQTPEQWLEEAQNKLADGDTVKWVGETGLPRWFRVRVGTEEGVTPVLVWDNTCTINTHAIALVEICPDPKRDSYRFEAEVRQNYVDKVNARVGLYVMHRAYTANQRGHLFAYWSFSEQVPRDRFGKEPPKDMRVVRAEFFATYVQMAPPARFAPEKINDGRAVEFTEQKLEEFDWRPIVIDVSPNGVTVRFDNKELTYPRAGRLSLDMFAKAAKVPGEDPAEFDPRGGLGLYVSASSASFRNVRVGPLPAK